MKVLVTGANGFVGRAVYRRLVAGGHMPLAAVRRTAGLPEEALLVDADDGPGWRAALAGCDVVVHLAARAHVMREQAAAIEPLVQYRAVNVDLALKVANHAHAAGVRRYVFVSSIKVHGETAPADAPCVEESLLAPQDAYGRSKLEAEEGLRRIAAQTGLEIVIVRPPLVYGPGVRANFAALVRLATSGFPLPLGCVRDNRRSLVALDNLADFIVTCCERPAAANQLFLISDGEDVSTAELLRRIAAAHGKKARLLPVPAAWLRFAARATGRPGLVQRLLDSLVVDSSKARSLLSWNPPVTMDEQLRKMAEHDPHA